MIDETYPYPKTRSSDSSDVGMIPEHWETSPLARVGRFIRGQGGSKVDNAVTGTACVRYGELYTRFEYSIRKPHSYVTATRAESYTAIAKGDVLFALSGETVEDIGASAENRIEAVSVCGGDIAVLRPSRAFCAGFLGYACRARPSSSQKSRGATGTTVKHTRIAELRRVVIAIPPVDEQHAIVRFLDHANHRIDRAIRAKRRLIALLNEQKQAIIHRAVTRGLDPDVPMKDSGVPWLGEIPAHWEPLQVRRLVSLVTSGSRGWASYYADEGYIFLQSGNLGRAMALNLDRVQHVRPPRGAEGERTRVQVGDVLVCITGALTGNVALVESPLAAPAFINQHVALCRPRAGSVEPRYLAYVLHSDVGRTQFKGSEYGGTKQGLGLGDVKAVCVALPSLAEQRAICRSLDLQTAGLLAAIAQTSRFIAAIREYRTRLTSDVVTGQLDVRAAARGLPDTPLDAGPAALDTDADLSEDEDIEEDAHEPL